MLKRQRSVKAQIKDILELFKTIMDFKGLSLSVIEQSLLKEWRPVFIFAMVMLLSV